MTQLLLARLVLTTWPVLSLANDQQHDLVLLMGISISTFIGSSTIHRGRSPGPRRGTHQYGFDFRPSSRGSSFGPSASLMCDLPNDVNAARARDFEAANLEAIRPATSLTAPSCALTSAPVPAPCPRPPKDLPPDTTATRIKELSGSPRSIHLPLPQLKDGSFGEFITAYPPQRLHAYPRAGRAFPTTKACLGGLFDLDEVVTGFGNTCSQFEDNVQALVDEMRLLELQLWAMDCLVEDLQKMGASGGRNVLQTVELESSIFTASEEAKDLRLQLLGLQEKVEQYIGRALVC